MPRKAVVPTVKHFLKVQKTGWILSVLTNGFMFDDT